MNWTNVPEVVVGGLLVLILAAVFPYVWGALRLILERKTTVALEWICFAKKHPGLIRRVVWPPVDPPRSRFYYSPERPEYFMSEEDTREGVWAIPRGSSRGIRPPGEYLEVEFLGRYDEIRLYHRNPLFRSKADGMGFYVTRWRNNRLIRKFYKKYPEAEMAELREAADNLKARGEARFYGSPEDTAEALSALVNSPTLMEEVRRKWMGRKDKRHGGGGKETSPPES